VGPLALDEVKSMVKAMVFVVGLFHKKMMADAALKIPKC
jgi:hypothetical protein